MTAAIWARVARIFACNQKPYAQEVRRGNKRIVIYGARVNGGVKGGAGIRLKSRALSAGGKRRGGMPRSLTARHFSRCISADVAAGRRGSGGEQQNVVRCAMLPPHDVPEDGV